MNEQPIHVPRWAVAILITVLLQLFSIVFAAGVLWSKVDGLSERMQRMEEHVLTERVAK